MANRRKTMRMLNPADKARAEGTALVDAHPIFHPLLARATVIAREGNSCPKEGWAVVTTNGQIHLHPTKRCEPAEWVYIVAHCLLHLGMGHFLRHGELRDREWNAACDCVVARFLTDLKLGRAPRELSGIVEIGTRDEEQLYRWFCAEGIPKELADWGTAGDAFHDMIHVAPDKEWQTGKPVNWGRIFAGGLIEAVDQAVRVAGGHELSELKKSAAQRARAWFVNSYPLLGAMAAGFKIIEDNLICTRMKISVAAVDAQRRELFINPACAMGDDEMRFVMAHELLHVGLCHQARQQGRDAYLWNVACDYVINGWLIEMELGVIPKFGGLYDAELKGLSAEGVYDRIVTDMRRYRKLATLRGVGLCDMLETSNPRWWECGAGIDLDSFYRRCMAHGLRYHEEGGRGLLPLGLTQEIEALAQPAVAWDVELARWFDHHFSPLEKRRSFARVSRRQSATPEIPRPRWVEAPGAEDGRTFGVVLDTSQSMSPAVLGMALGAIASYSMSRDVPLVRVVFCDAVAYDAGYLRPEGIARGLRVKGRGGTILQAGVDLLERAADFPAAGPILIITDGRCDRLKVRREHAYLMPRGATLPFVPVGPVFGIG